MMVHFVTKQRIEDLDDAITEANRFISRAAAARKDLESNEFRSTEYAAAKRSSMDLTRALANVRRNHWNGKPA